LVLSDHLYGLLVARLLLEGVDCPVVAPGLALALMRPLNLVFIHLARVLGQIGAKLFVTYVAVSVINVLRDIACEDALFLSLSGALLGVVERTSSGTTPRSHAELHADAHLLSAPETSESISAAKAVARSIFS
jgi:hypothetical protein